MTQPLRIRGKIKLKDFEPDFTDDLDKPKTKVRTDVLCRRIGELQHLLYANAKNSLVILFQGMDASGKDGASKRVLEFVNPCGVETTSFKTPSREESAHDFLWRIHKAVPRYGNIGIFNRSHYEEVLIVRVLKLQPESVWKTRYDDINAFEKILTRNGVILLKFFLHISEKEQKKRFQKIEANPLEVGLTRTRCVATMLKGGHADNALPQSATATVNCRIFPGVQPKDVQAQLQAAVGPKVEVTPDPLYIGVPTPASPVRADVVNAVKAAAMRFQFQVGDGARVILDRRFQARDLGDGVLPQGFDRRLLAAITDREDVVERAMQLLVERVFAHDDRRE